jgi:hypothetical protein
MLVVNYVILSANAFQSQNKAESVDIECHHCCHTLIGLASASSSAQELALYTGPVSDS